MDVLVGVVEQFSQLVGLALGDKGGPLLDAGGSGRLVDLGGGRGGEDEGESEGREDGAKEVVAHQEIVGGGRGKGERKGPKKGRPEVGRPFEVEEGTNYFLSSSSLSSQEFLPQHLFFDLQSSSSFSSSSS